jgi:hypothetical protein
VFLTKSVSNIVLSECAVVVTHIICIGGARFCKMYLLRIVLLNCNALSLQFQLLKLAAFCHYEGQQPNFGRITSTLTCLS